MGVLSKLCKISSYSYHGVTVSQAAYTAGLALYLGGLLYPRWRKNRGGHLALPEEEARQSKRSGPSVNREFFVKLRNLLKVCSVDYEKSSMITNQLCEHPHRSQLITTIC